MSSSSSRETNKASKDQRGHEANRIVTVVEKLSQPQPCGARRDDGNGICGKPAEVAYRSESKDRHGMITKGVPIPICSDCAQDDSGGQLVILGQVRQIYEGNIEGAKIIEGLTFFEDCSKCGKPADTLVIYYMSIDGKGGGMFLCNACKKGITPVKFTVNTATSETTSGASKDWE